MSPCKKSHAETLHPLGCRVDSSDLLAHRSMATRASVKISLLCNGENGPPAAGGCLFMMGGRKLDRRAVTNEQYLFCWCKKIAGHSTLKYLAAFYHRHIFFQCKATGLIQDYIYIGNYTAYKWRASGSRYYAWHWNRFWMHDRFLVSLSLSRFAIARTLFILWSGSTYHTFYKIRCLSVVLRIWK